MNTINNILYVVALFYNVLIGIIPFIIGFLVSPIITGFQGGIEFSDIAENKLKNKFYKGQ